MTSCSSILRTFICLLQEYAFSFPCQFMVPLTDGDHVTNDSYHELARVSGITLHFLSVYLDVYKHIQSQNAFVAAAGARREKYLFLRPVGE
jgi:hypothetical protein